MSATAIRHVEAMEVLDSRGYPTVAATVILEDGSRGSAMVPSGASTGSREALELRDGDAKRYQGKGVSLAVQHIHQQLGPLLQQRDAIAQQELDQLMLANDGSDNKGNLGANAILAVSLAIAHSAAAAQNIPLYQHITRLYQGSHSPSMPVPMMNLINGGCHANNALDLQEFMIIPVGFQDFATALRAGAEIFYCLKQCLQDLDKLTGVGDEGGFAPTFNDSQQALDALTQAIEKAGYRVGEDILLALDCAASEFYDGNDYQLKGLAQKMSASQLCDYLSKLTQDFPIASIEDGMAEDDWTGWQTLNKRLGQHIQLVGDDVFVTNVKLLQKGINTGVANSILIKLNQIGTLSETLATIEMAQKAGYGVIISHRSGETEDTTIADLAVGTGARQIKTGSLCRSERTAKYNRLLAIAQHSANTLSYPGKTALTTLNSNH